MLPPRANITTQNAWLGKEFGEQFARRLFGDEVIDALPRYSKGKNVGKHKATVEWKKCESGGWVSFGVGGHGYVERRVGQILCARIVIRPWGGGTSQVLHDKSDPEGRYLFELGEFQ